MIEHGVEMHGRDQRRQVGRGLVEAEVLAVDRVVGGQADLGVDDLNGSAWPVGLISEPISMKPKPEVALSSWRSRTTSRDSYRGRKCHGIRRPK
jgi:hypothetical protein